MRDTLEEQMTAKAEQGLLALGMDEDTAETYAPWLAMVPQFIPLVGAGVGVDNTRDAIQEGRYKDAAIEGGLTLLGEVPVVGDWAAAAIKGIRRAPTSLLDDGIDAAKKAAGKKSASKYVDADGNFDEAAWISDNPRPAGKSNDKPVAAWRKRKQNAKIKADPDSYAAKREAERARLKKQYHEGGGKEQKKQYQRENSEVISSRKKKHYEENKEEILSKNKEYRENNPEKVKAGQKRYRENNPEKIKEAQKRFQEQNPNYHRRDRHRKTMRKSMAKRRAAKIQRTPEWADVDKMNEIHDIAHEASLLTGVPYEVDHIAPMQGKTVSGLNTQGNLRVIPKSEHASKLNKFEPGQKMASGGLRQARKLIRELRKVHGKPTKTRSNKARANRKRK